MSKLKEILRNKKMSQRELAKEVGISHQSINNFITGRYDMTSKNLYKIAKFLNVPMEELVEED